MSDAPRTGPWIAIALVVMLSLTASALCGPLTCDREQQRILRDGEPAEAVILEVIDTGDRMNEDPLVIVRLEVHRPRVAPYEARVTRVMSAVELVRYPEGAAVDVRVDPDAPELVAIVGPRRP